MRLALGLQIAKNIQLALLQDNTTNLSWTDIDHSQHLLISDNSKGLNTPLGEGESYGVHGTKQLDKGVFDR